MTLLTIVTVVRNDPTGLRATLSSITSQQQQPDELVIVDGSDDATVVPLIVRDAGELEATIVWRPPRGVYPAMNDGLAEATGRYVYFLNAGDELADATVIRGIWNALDHASPMWAYGPVQFLAADGARLPSPDWQYPAERGRLFARGRFPAHQGVVAQREALRSVGAFDTSYRVAADYAAICHLSRIADPLELDFLVAVFRVGGLSTTDWRQGLREFHRARREAFAPTGGPRLLEHWDTARIRVATTAYRTLWAPGRPLHGVAERLRGAR